jgi:hypothetical protein
MALRRALEYADFQAVFAEDDAIREHWPLPTD